MYEDISGAKYKPFSKAPQLPFELTPNVKVMMSIKWPVVHIFLFGCGIYALQCHITNCKREGKNPITLRTINLIKKHLARYYWNLLGIEPKSNPYEASKSELEHLIEVQKILLSKKYFYGGTSYYVQNMTNKFEFSPEKNLDEKYV